jgi:hypothetical protein
VGRKRFSDRYYPHGFAYALAPVSPPQTVANRRLRWLKKSLKATGATSSRSSPGSTLVFVPTAAAP